jgi:hypothetical protein
MPVASTSRYAGLPVFDAPDSRGTLHPSIAIRPLPTPPVAAYQRTVAALDTLETLSWTCFHSSTTWWRIADANALVYPFEWRPGDVVVLPSSIANGNVVRTRKF